MGWGTWNSDRDVGLEIKLQIIKNGQADRNTAQNPYPNSKSKNSETHDFLTIYLSSNC